MTIDASTVLGILAFLGQLVAGIVWLVRLEAKVEHLQARLVADLTGLHSRLSTELSSLQGQVAACRSGWQDADEEQQERLEKGAGRFSAVEDALHKIATSQAVTAEQMKTVSEKLERMDRSLHALHGQVSGRPPKHPTQTGLEAHL